MIRNLRARHLIDTQGSGSDQLLLIHRSLQLSLLHKLDEDHAKLQAIFNLAVSLTRRMFPRQSPVQFAQNNIWEQCQAYSLQVMSVMSVQAGSSQPLECSIDYALLLSDTSNYFWERNIFSDALRTSDAADAACQHFRGSHEATRADIHTIAGAVRDTCGISERARALYHYEMAVALRQEHLNKGNTADMTSDDLWNYANAWGNMTTILLDYECYGDVILYADLAMTIKRKLLGSGEESIIACYEQNRNKHLALAALGRLEEAKEWEADPENCIEDPTYTNYMIRYHFSHANISVMCGQLEQAHASLQMVLGMRTKIFGATGRSTLDTYYMLAMVELGRSNADAAE
jgi:tetratricopeptide (TPR) repeat protein